MSNEFFGFSPESFEQFARALSVAVFGAGVSAFGNGPDGGREATFRGEVSYPYPPATRWSGYGVIQAKYKEKTENTQVNQQWALKHLKQEMEAFVNSELRHPKPQYYVFVTNVELTSASKGGKDKAEKLIRSYYGKLPFKGHAIWDANQLTVLLSNHEQLRRRFREFLTPGDVLSAILDSIELKQPNPIRILSMFLERELRADATARLDQAGNRTDDQLDLAQLFFDLPASIEPQISMPEENVDNSGRLPNGVLWEIMTASSRKLDPKTLYDQETSSPEGESRHYPARFVLLGGPGSGKSTLGQFLAQIHRAALLIRMEPHLLGQKSREIIEETRNLCDREGLPWPATPRYPFRVELNRFAKALSSSKTNDIKSLAGYLRLELKGEHTLTHEDFIEWMTNYRSILIFDGLDEVPRASNRGQVVKLVNDFLSELRQMGADVFVVATSRHQGYEGEFSSGIVEIRHILPLSVTRSLRYVEKYANVRFGRSNPQKAQEIISRLRETSKRQLTSQLMSSPLQITFMATVVAARGDPGQDRWQLFDSYYRTIYDRERQKAVPPYDTVLSRQQPIIDRLHHDIGFWLQYRGETVEDSGVSLTIDIFERLVDAYISEIGREDPDKKELVKLITDAARHRLVFLTSRVEGELSFDVRSLQEYMAAECITSGDPELVKLRLRAIASVSYWRNVFLFASSKCFADTHSRHLQDFIRVLCEDLNSSADRLVYFTKIGSELALDILQSGAVAENHNYSRHLVRVSLSLLEQPYLRGEGLSIAQRLTVIYRNYLESIYRDNIKLWLGQSEIERTLGAWPLLLRLCQKNIQWANELLHRYWPSDLYNLEKLAPVISEVDKVPYAKQRLEELFISLPPSKAISFIRSLEIDSMETSDLLGVLHNLSRGVLSDTEIPILIPGDSEKGCGFTIISIYQRGKISRDIFYKLSQIKDYHPSWLPYVLAGYFVDSPNRATLAEILEECANRGWQPDNGNYSLLLPWPISLAFKSAKSSDDLLRIAKSLRNSDDIFKEDWGSLEEQWEKEGVSLNQIQNLDRQPDPIDILLGRVEFPPLTRWRILHRNYPDSSIKELYNAAVKTPIGDIKNAMIWFLVLAGETNHRFWHIIKPSELRDLFTKVAVEKRKRDLIIFNYPVDLNETEEWIEYYDWLGSVDMLRPSHRFLIFDYKPYNDEWCILFQDSFIRDGIKKNTPVRQGLLVLLSYFVLSGKKIEKIPPEMLNLDLYTEPRYKFSALLVRISQRNFELGEAQKLAKEAIKLLSTTHDEYFNFLIFRTIDAHLNDDESFIEFLLHLRERMTPELSIGVADCDTALRRIVKGRSSSIQSIEELRRLQLPNVYEYT